MMPWVYLQFVIMVFPDHTPLLFTIDPEHEIIVLIASMQEPSLPVYPCSDVDEYLD